MAKETPKTCLVTGANSGIGNATAMELAKRNMAVICVCRSQEKGHRAVQGIKNASGNPCVELMLADLRNQSEIRALVTQFGGRYERLDVLINNAAAMPAQRTESDEGIEEVLAVNLLAPFLLTQLLLPSLRRANQARVINVASEGQWFSGLRLDDLQFRKRRYGPMRAYGQSKLALIMYTYALARRLKGTGVTANCLHPGGVRTNFGGGGNWFSKLVLKLSTPFMVSQEEGAVAPTYLATSPELDGVSGEYFHQLRIGKSRPLSYDQQLQDQLWRQCEILTSPADND